MVTPGDLAEALEMLSGEPGGWRPFAGGTDLMVLLEAGKLTHKKFLNIRKLSNLLGIIVSSDHVAIGAMTTYSDVRRNESLVREFPLLARAAAETGGIATQNRGTLGGNIANASPAADSPPPLMVYEAQLELVSSRSVRHVPYTQFHTGYKQMDLRSDELIRAIRIPRMGIGWKQHYRKVGTRRAQAISKVCFAGAARIEAGRVAEARIAFGSVAPIVFRASQTERLLQGEKTSASVLKAAQETLAREIAPIDDIRSTAHYRLRVAQNLLGEFLEMLSS
jgi:CO/xanthine dehydrogenase FAD-binding subunit